MYACVCVCCVGMARKARASQLNHNSSDHCGKICKTNLKKRMLKKQNIASKEVITRQQQQQQQLYKNEYTNEWQNCETHIHIYIYKHKRSLK